ncbi:MAG: hypothetical protein ACK528_05820, partial [Alphaproteobacteria bacterium]
MGAGALTSSAHERAVALQMWQVVGPPVDTPVLVQGFGALGAGIALAAERVTGPGRRYVVGLGPHEALCGVIRAMERDARLGADPIVANALR